MEHPAYSPESHQGEHHPKREREREREQTRARELLFSDKNIGKRGQQNAIYWKHSAHRYTQQRCVFVCVCAREREADSEITADQ